MLLFRFTVMVSLTWLLLACGGGGTPGVDPTKSATTVTPTIALELRSSSGAVVTTIDALDSYTLRATVRDAKGALVGGQLVTFSGDAAKLRFNPADATALTNAVTGVATVQVFPATAASSGAGNLTAAVSVGGVAGVSTTLGYQVTAVGTQLTLQALDLGAGALAAYGNRAVSTVAVIDGVAATNVPIQVTFSASCGTVSPSVVTTDAAGKATTTYKADSPSCAGSNVTLTAASPGANTVSATMVVQAAVGSNLLFVSATPQRIYLAGSVGATQAQVSFRLVDSSGNPLQNQIVQLTLVNTAAGATLGILGNTAALSLSTDADGLVSVSVFPGTVPASVQVKATLVANAAVATTSNNLTVASGRPVQSRISLALSVRSIEGWDIDGNTSQLMLSMADRQGNPVPDGTQVNFVASGGVLIPPTCVVAGGSSQCSVAIRSGNPRPTNGRVAILAYVPGEEDFVDANGNNVFDAGEAFSDLGNAYRDDNENSGADVGEFFVPRAGAALCAGGVNGKLNTCDGVWGAVDVRAKTMVIFASSTGTLAVLSKSTNAIVVELADIHGNSMPTGTTIAVKISGSTSTCTIDSVLPAAVKNTLSPTTVTVSLGGSSGPCGGPSGTAPEAFDIEATSPSGEKTASRVSLP